MKAIAFTNNVDKKNINKEIESNPKQFVEEKLTGNKFDFGVDEITTQGIFKLMGYKYDLRQFLTKFVYKQYGNWQEIYALNKTNVRYLVGGKIDKIIEVI